MNHTRKIEILSFLEGALAAFTEIYGEKIGFLKSICLLQETYSKRPIFRSELKEVLDEFKSQS
jgi:hypothetical protein